MIALWRSFVPDQCPTWQVIACGIETQGGKEHHISSQAVLILHSARKKGKRYSNLDGSFDL
jgi:hypothetical protein